jgi:tRNA U55 pseudouridine synthase TruB
MGRLTRTRSGIFRIGGAVTLNVIKQAMAEGRVSEYITPVEEALPYPRVFIEGDGARRALNGNTVIINNAVDGDKCWLHHAGGLIGLFSAAQVDSEWQLTPEVMLNG